MNPFLWGGLFRKKWALVASDKLCLPKMEGGLGIHDTKIINNALRGEL